MQKQWREEYKNGFKRKLVGPRNVGLEFEMPIVTASNGFSMFDFRPVLQVLVDEMGGAPYYDDFYHTLQAVTMPDGTVITNDSGYGNAEIAFKEATDLYAAKKKFDEWMSLLIELVQEGEGKARGKILGYGIQPVQKPKKSNWIQKRRNEVVCRNFGCIHDVNITIMSSSQVHVEVTQDEVAMANNVFNWLTGVIIAMFANSPIWQGRIDENNRLAVRERMWWFTPDSRHGIFPGPQANLDDIFDRIMSMRHLVAKNSHDYFIPKSSFRSFLTKNPERAFADELPALEGTMWYCTRPRSLHGTVEVRPACAQPRESALALPAFSLGIVENLEKASTAIDSRHYPWDIAREMREEAIDFGLKGEIDGIDLASIAETFLAISEEGLKKRGLGEEEFLFPLWQRVRSKKTLAEEVVEIFKQEGMPGLVERLAFT